MDMGDTLRLLQTGTLEVEGLLPWSSNYAFLVRVCDEPEEAGAVYKPRRGERPLWDFPQGTLCQREVAAFLVSQALGWPVVPPTVLRQGQHGVGSVQLFIEHDPERHYFTFEGDAALRPQLQQIALLDLIINNADRKGGHVLVDETEAEIGNAPRLWAIDHGICFHTEPKLRTVIWEFAGMPVAGDLLAALTILARRLTDESDSFRLTLETLLSSLEMQALQQRVNRLLRRPVFPQPGPGRHYPWPPV